MEWSVRDVAERLNVVERTVLHWVRDKGLPSVRSGGQYRFNRAEVLAWATERAIPFPQDLFADARGGVARLPSFAEALEAGGVHHNLAARGRDAVLRAIVAVLPLPGSVDRDLLFRMLLARETLASTAVGDGIAIPHPRNPIVLRVPAPQVTLCTLKTPVDFGALDGRPVHALFTLVSPAPRIHLHLLARLSFLLRRPKFRQRIAERAPAADLLAEIRRAEADMADPADGGRACP